MALSNIQQVDNILVALNTSEEAVKKDLEVLKIPSFAVLEQSGLGDTSVNSFYDELKAHKSPSSQHGKSTSLRRLSHRSALTKFAVTGAVKLGDALGLFVIPREIEYTVFPLEKIIEGKASYLAHVASTNKLLAA